jgi:single-stranded-DNA-specific exonuclease
VVPLFGENRILVDWGLKHMSESRLPFLQRYWKRRIFGSKKQRPFRPEDISFYIAPRLNSASRLCSADSAFQFMISVQDKELEKLGAGLENMNRNRILRLQSLRKSTDLVYYPLSAQPVIVVDTRSEELGLLGLLASSIVDSTGRAAIVLGRSPNGLLAGSARSTEFLNLKALLDSVSDVLKSHGGHHRAAGLSLEPERLPEFLLKLEEVGQLKSFIVDKTEYYEAILPADEFNEGFFRQYESLGPFGKDNEPPVFGLSGFSLSYFRRKAAGGGSFMLNLNGKEFKSTFKKECDFDLTNGIPAQIFGSFCRDNKGENKLIFKMKGFQQSA